MLPPRFCDQCGKSLVPLTGPHVERPCAECGRIIHVAEPGEGGTGIRVEKGDKFVLPPGSISLSLDPRKTTGRFSRSGLAWFVSHLIVQPLSREPEALDELFEYWEKEGEVILKASDKLSDLNLDDDADQEKAVAVIKQHDSSLEWWALFLILNSARSKEFLEEGRPPEAVLAACRAQAAFAMTVYMRDLDEYVWTGYQHIQLIYGIAKASAQTPAEAEAIQALKPIFENLSEDVLHAWVESGSDIGPRIGVTDVDEKMLEGTCPVPSQRVRAASTAAGT